MSVWGVITNVFENCGKGGGGSKFWGSIEITDMPKNCGKVRTVGELSESLEKHGDYQHAQKLRKQRKVFTESGGSVEITNVPEN